MPKIIGKYKNYNMPFITNRLIELLLQEIKYYTGKESDGNYRRQSKIIVVFSNTEQEGKTFILGKAVDKLRAVGDRVLSMNYEFVQDHREDFQHKKITKEKKLLSQISNPLSLLRSIFANKKNDAIFETYKNKDNINYQIDDSFSDKHDIFDLLKNQDINSLDNYNYIFIELPAIINNFYPSSIIAQSDLTIAITRSNREWKKADTNAVEMFSQYLKNKPLVFLNGTEIEETEGLLGTLPKKRSQLRKMVKQLLKFQFYTKSSIR